MDTGSPLIVILGPTATGKSELAIIVAEKFNGEIISADSRTVYKGLSIGTAKPSLIDQSRINHHLLDVVLPDTQFSVAMYKDMANKAIADILKEGKLPIVVGGSGLYLYSLIYDYNFRINYDLKIRNELNKMSIGELIELIKSKKLPLPKDPSNPRRLIRVIETNGAEGTKKKLRARTLLIGLDFDREILRERITHRVNKMVKDGFIDELRNIVEIYGWDAPGLNSPGYKAFRLYLDGKLSLEKAKEKFIQNDMALARRQKTWFSNNESIQWLNDKDKVVDLVTSFLNK